MDVQLLRRGAVKSDTVGRLAASLGDEYTVEREIVGGGMSDIFVAWQNPPGRRVVVKTLAPQLAAALDVERFNREIAALAQLQHPHILPLYDVGVADGALFFTTPFIDGESLRERLARVGRLPLDEALRLAAEVASALEFSHRKGFVHRDIKPANILLEDGHAIVADFGIARAVSASARAGAMTITGTGIAVGTPAYMSPEQASGEHGDERSDVYALGCVLFEMLTGSPPFAGLPTLALLAQRVTRDAPRVGQLREDIPPSLDELLARTLARDPALRPRSAELERELELLRHPVTLAGEPSATPSVAPGRTRSRRAAVGLAAGLVVVTLLAAVFINSRFSRKQPPLDANIMIVAPFATVGARDSLWREGLADVLVRALDGAGPLHVVPTRVVLRASSGRANRADRTSTLALARRTGAGLALFGALSPVGPESSRVTATLVDVATGAVIAEQEMTGFSARLPTLAESIARGLLLDLSTRRGMGIVRPAGSIGSTSLPAIKAFLRGDQAFRRAAWDSAQTYYEQAVALDSTFALAIRQLGRVAAWRGSMIGVGVPRADSMMLAFAQRASRFAHGLGARDSLLILSDSLTAAHASRLCVDPDVRGRLLRTTSELTTRFPSDPETWVARGDALYVCGGYFALNEPDIGKREMLQAYDSAIVLDPDLAQAYDRAFRLALDLGDTARVLRYADKYLTLHPSEASASYLRLITALLRRPGDAAAILDTTPSANVFLAFASLLLYPDSAELVVPVARRLGSTTAPGGTWDTYNALEGWMPAAPFRHRPLALALAYRGHLRDAAARAGLDRSRFAARLAGELALFGALPAVAVDSTFQLWLHERPFRHDEAIMSALAWWGSRHDTAALREYLLHARTPWTRGPIARRGARYAHRLQVAEAYLALARADTAAAIRRLVSLPSDEWWTYERLVAARLLVARSRPAEAFAVLDRGFPYPYASPLYGLWAIEHARLASRLGERAKARESFDFVARLWRAADPELQPYVREARAELAKLGRSRVPGS